MGPDLRSRRAAHLGRVGDRRMVAPKGGEMVAHCVAGDALMVTAVEGRRQAEGGPAGRFPEAGFLRPIRLPAAPHRDPDPPPALCGIPPPLFCPPPELAQDLHP